MLRMVWPLGTHVHPRWRAAPNSVGRYATRSFVTFCAAVMCASCSLHRVAGYKYEQHEVHNGSMNGEDIFVRVARPTDKLAEVTVFYRDALGLPVIGKFENHAGYSGVMFGAPGDRFHIEFTHKDGGSPGLAPTKDNLLVLYYQDQPSYDSAINRMIEHGNRPVAPENPYWDGRSLTFEDPDGWRVVLYRGVPFGAG